MFGPNPTVSASRVCSHHRDGGFKKLLLECIQLFKSHFDPNDIFDVLPLSGSGTFGIESVIYSIKGVVDVQDYHEDFAGRILQMVYANGDHDMHNGSHDLYVQYETSISKLNTICQKKGLLIVDAVSSFPYYPLDTLVDVAITVSSKQLGGIPGIVFVLVRKSVWSSFESRPYSCLDLKSHKKYAEQGMTQNTPNVDALVSVCEVLREFDLANLRRRIDAAREILCRLLPTSCIIGEGPVLSIVKDVLSVRFIKQWGLYCQHGPVQLFLWTDDLSDKFLTAFQLEVEANAERSVMPA